LVELTENNRLSSIPYVDKVERIYRVFLSRKIKKLTWYRVAKEAEVAFGWTHRVLKDLESDGIIKGNKIRDPSALFKKWTDRKDRRAYREYHVQDPTEILRTSKMDYALTGYFAENLIGHYLFPRYYQLYIRLKDASYWHSLLLKNGYVGKGNIQILIADEHVFYEKGLIDGWPTVSTQQLIVDLYREGAESVEAAELLLKRAYE